MRACQGASALGGGTTTAGPDPDPGDGPRLLRRAVWSVLPVCQTWAAGVLAVTTGTWNGLCMAVDLPAAAEEEEEGEVRAVQEVTWDLVHPRAPA